MEKLAKEVEALGTKHKAIQALQADEISKQLEDKMRKLKSLIKTFKVRVPDSCKCNASSLFGSNSSAASLGRR